MENIFKQVNKIIKIDDKEDLKNALRKQFGLSTSDEEKRKGNENCPVSVQIRKFDELCGRGQSTLRGGCVCPPRACLTVWLRVFFK